MEEQWRDVVEYEGVYQVSNLGRVKRVAAGRRTYAEKILNPSLGKRAADYPHIDLYDISSHRKRKRFMVHVLVAQAFLGPIPEGHEVNHKDGDKANAAADNLEYVTRSGNRLHAMEILGVGPDNRGSRNGQAILSESDVLKIRKMYATGQYYLRELADQFGVCRPAITDIVNHRTWTHVGGPCSSITYRPLKAARNGNAKLTPDQVRQIRSLSTTYSDVKLAQMFGVSDVTIANARRRKTYADIM